MTTLAELRTIATKLGLPEDLYADRPENEQETLIRDYAEGLITQLAAQGMTLEDYLAIRDASARFSRPTPLLSRPPDTTGRGRRS